MLQLHTAWHSFGSFRGFIWCSAEPRKMLQSEAQQRISERGSWRAHVRRCTGSRCPTLQQPPSAAQVQFGAMQTHQLQVGLGEDAGTQHHKPTARAVRLAQPCAVMCQKLPCETTQRTAMQPPALSLTYSPQADSWSSLTAGACLHREAQPRGPRCPQGSMTELASAGLAAAALMAIRGAWEQQAGRNLPAYQLSTGNWGTKSSA